MSETANPIRKPRLARTVKILLTVAAAAVVVFAISQVRPSNNLIDTMPKDALAAYGEITSVSDSSDGKVATFTVLRAITGDLKEGQVLQVDIPDPPSAPNLSVGEKQTWVMHPATADQGAELLTSGAGTAEILQAKTGRAVLSPEGASALTDRILEVVGVPEGIVFPSPDYDTCCYINSGMDHSAIRTIEVKATPEVLASLASWLRTANWVLDESSDCSIETMAAGTCNPTPRPEVPGGYDKDWRTIARYDLDPPTSTPMGVSYRSAGVDFTIKENLKDPGVLSLTINANARDTR